MRTASQLKTAIGAKGLLRTSEGLLFTVSVIDVKEVYGQVRFLVEPQAGIPNAAWVSNQRVTFPLPLAELEA